MEKLDQLERGCRCILAKKETHPKENIAHGGFPLKMLT
jgi:hypothetical protein